LATNRIQSDARIVPSEINKENNVATYEYGITDFRYIAAGAAVLGSGGGGSYTDAVNVINELSSQWSGSVVVQDYDGVSSCCVLAMMGSPDAGDTLKLADVEAAITNTVNAIQEATRIPLTCVVPVEIGALNSIIPLIAAAMPSNTLWVVDGDGAGRAVPELVQTTYSGAADLATSPCALANDADGSAVQSAILNASTAAQVEDLSRGVVSASFGSVAGIAAWPSNASNAYALKGNYIPATLSQAWTLGQYLLTTAAPPPTAQVADAISGITGRAATAVITNFYITQVTQTTAGGFDTGLVRLDNTPDPSTSTETHYLYNLNESLIMYSSLSSAPDIVAPDSICYYSESTGLGFSNSADDLAIYNGTGKTVSIIKVNTASQLYNAPGVLASFSGLLKNIGYAGALPAA
jgi:uncharacterized protein